MVKNFGGNKSKRMGRKFIQPASKSTRFVSEDGEMYAIVAKHLGNSQIHALCSDGITRLCCIRQKFKGRSKRDNFVSVGIWILIGTREWEVRATEKIDRCDLLEVYSSTDIENIKNSSDIPLNVLIKFAETEENIQSNDTHFTENTEVIDEPIPEENINIEQNNIEDIIDFDDI